MKALSRLSFWCASLWLAMVAYAPPAQADEATLLASLTVKVTQRDEASDTIIAKARELGGYFSELGGERVVLRVPTAQADALLEAAAALGVVVDRQVQREDHTMELAQMRSRLEAREKMLAQYMELLNGASAKAVITVEREITTLISQIEDLKGGIRFKEHQVAYASVNVWFQFRDRSAPARDGSSSFVWMNTLNMADLVNDFRYVGRRGRNRLMSTPPEGFAAFRSRDMSRATSPDSVLMCVRKARHKPKADLDFWKEALKNRMLAAGYHLQSEADIQAGDIPGTLLELTAPLGQEDYTYLVAVFPHGRKLLIVEAAGEVTGFEARRESILTAIRGL